MRAVLLKELHAHHQDYYDKEVKVSGWLKSLRKSKNFSFLVISDGSHFKDIQIIVDHSVAGVDDLLGLRTGSSLSIKGKFVQSDAKQPYEIHLLSFEIYQVAPEDYPLQKKGTSFEFLRDISHLRARTNTFGSIFRLRDAMARATHDFFEKEGFFYLNSPIITSMDAEGAGELFRVTTLDLQKIATGQAKSVDFSKDYFGKESYLCVTGQLEAEAYALAMGRVYTFGPTFRSENSNTARHLSEFWMIEPEAAFFDLEDNADLASRYVMSLVDQAYKRCPDEMEFFSKFIDKGLHEKLEKVQKRSFEKITYTKAIEILQKCSKTFDYPVEWGLDLQTEHERYLTDEYFKSPVIVTDYPKSIKAFYMKQNEDGKTVRAMDILVPGVGEIIGGSQREDDLDKLQNRMQELHLDPEPYDWYLDLRKYGSVPHSGFGLGFERALMYLSSMSNIRDVIPFHRTVGHLKF